MRRFAWLSGIVAIGALGCTGDEFRAGSSGGGDGVGATGGAGIGATGGGGGTDDGCASGTACLPEVPDGWTGIATLYRGANAPEACPEGAVSEVRGGAGELDAPHTCTACQCGEPAGVTCSAPTVSIYSTGSCNPPALAVIELTPSDCPQTLSPAGLKSTPSTAIGGECEPSGGEPQLGEPTFAEEALLCDFGDAIVGDAACVDGACAPLPADPFHPAFCVYKADDVGCPPSFPERTAIYGEVDDERGCLACACGAPTGVSCAEALQGYSNASCGTVVDSIPTDTLCHNLSGSMASVKYHPEADGGACPESGGQPTGAAMPIAATTVCCTR